MPILFALLLVLISVAAQGAPPPPPPPLTISVDRRMSPEEQIEMDQMNAFARVYERFARSVAIGHLRDTRTERELVAAWLTLANGPAHLPLARAPRRRWLVFGSRGD